MIFYGRKQYDKAMADLDQALQLNSKCVAAHINRGNVLDDTGRTEQALADYDAAASIDPLDPEVFYNRAVAHSKLGSVGKARNDFEKAAALYKKNGRMDLALEAEAKLSRIPAK
jgi:tetratricopeptide (TPR) repeat protein